MFSHYQHHATSYANLAIASAHAIVDDLHRQARGLAPRFADETADSGCTNIRPSDDQPRRQQAWDILAEALAWNLIADHVDLVVEAKGLEARNVAYQVGWIYSWDATDANPEGAYVKVLDALCVDGTPANVQVAADGTRFVGDPRALEDEDEEATCENADCGNPLSDADTDGLCSYCAERDDEGGPYGSDEPDEPFSLPAAVRAVNAAAQAAAAITSASVTTLSREDTPGRTGAGRWLDLIHEVNRLAPGTFGSPEIVPATANTPYTEVYPDALVLIDEDPDGYTTVSSRNVAGARLIALAAAKLNLGVSLA